MPSPSPASADANGTTGHGGFEVRDLAVTSTGARPVRTLDGISLSVAPGECLGVLGESGVGQSTLAQCRPRPPHRSPHRGVRPSRRPRPPQPGREGVARRAMADRAAQQDRPTPASRAIVSEPGRRGSPGWRCPGRSGWCRAGASHPVPGATHPRARSPGKAPASRRRCRGRRRRRGPLPPPRRRPARRRSAMARAVAPMAIVTPPSGMAAAGGSPASTPERPSSCGTAWSPFGIASSRRLGAPRSMARPRREDVRQHDFEPA